MKSIKVDFFLSNSLKLDKLHQKCIFGNICILKKYMTKEGQNQITSNNKAFFYEIIYKIIIF